MSTPVADCGIVCWSYGVQRIKRLWINKLLFANSGNLNWKREVYCGRGIIPPLNIGYWGGWDNWTVAAVCVSLLPSRKSTATDWEHSVVWGHLYHDWCACISLMLQHDFSNCAWFHVITYEGLWRFFLCLLLHHAAWQCHVCHHCRIGYSVPQGSSAVGKSLSEAFFDQGAIIFNVMLCSKDCIGCAGLSCF